MSAREKIATLMDDTAVPGSAKKRRIVAASVTPMKVVRRQNPMLSIEDNEDCANGSDDCSNDGAKDDDLDKSSIPPAGLVGTQTQKSRERIWGPFTFHWVWRVTGRGKNKGAITTQWECVCGKHKDNDGDDTLCRKTRTFVDEEDCEVQFVWLKR